MSFPLTRFNPQRERGAALIVGLIILIVITLLGLTALSSTVMEERMTGGQRNESLSFAGAESALRAGERVVYSQFATRDGRDPDNVLSPESLATGSMATPTGAISAAYRNTNAWVSVGSTTGYTYNTVDYAGMTAKAGGSKLDRNPTYVIEKLGTAGGCPLESHSCGGETFGTGGNGLAFYYRVTSRSTGGDARVMRMTESVYAVAR